MSYLAKVTGQKKEEDEEEGGETPQKRSFVLAPPPGEYQFRVKGTRKPVVGEKRGAGGKLLAVNANTVRKEDEEYMTIVVSDVEALCTSNRQANFLCAVRPRNL